MNSKVHANSVTISHLGLVPWRHFVPFRFDLSDLHRNVRLCFANDTMCQTIAKHGQNLQRRLLNFTRERLVQRLVLERIADLQCADERAYDSL